MQSRAKRDALHASKDQIASLGEALSTTHQLLQRDDANAILHLQRKASETTSSKSFCDFIASNAEDNTVEANNAIEADTLKLPLTLIRSATNKDSMSVMDV